MSELAVGTQAKVSTSSKAVQMDSQQTQNYAVNSNAVDKTPNKDTVELSSKNTGKKVAIGAAIAAVVVTAVALLMHRKPSKAVNNIIKEETRSLQETATEIVKNTAEVTAKKTESKPVVTEVMEKVTETVAKGTQPTANVVTETVAKETQAASSKKAKPVTRKKTKPEANSVTETVAKEDKTATSKKTKSEVEKEIDAKLESARKEQKPVANPSEVPPENQGLYGQDKYDPLEPLNKTDVTSPYYEDPMVALNNPMNPIDPLNDPLANPLGDMFDPLNPTSPINPLNSFDGF